MTELGPCQYIQDEINSLQAEIDDLRSSLQEVPPQLRPGLEKYIMSLSRQIRPLRLELQDCLRDPSKYALRLDGIEVTQAIQDMNQSVDLVATKTTVVRVYLSYPLSPAITVRGELYVSRSPNGPFLTIPSGNAVVLDPSQVGQLDAKRRNVQLSLNFTLPSEQTAEGELSISLASVTNVNAGTLFNISQINTIKVVTFTAAVPLRVRILGIRYQQGTPPVTYTPRQIDFDLINSWLRRAYPVA